MTRRSVCIVSGSRADYGLLHPLLQALEEADDFDLRIAVTGMHLSPRFGRTVRAIEADGFNIDARIESLEEGDDAAEIGRSIARGVAGFARYFDERRPDLLMMLGDRYEILAACIAALPAGIPVAHLCGGDITQGAYDDNIRHALTKMSHLHFVTNEAARRRVIQMGEEPEHVHLVGSTGIDHLKSITLPTREELAADLGLDIGRRWLLVTFHPVTRDPRPSPQQVDELLEALDTYRTPEFEIVFTQPNSDNDGLKLTRQIERWCSTRPNSQLFSSLGQIRYLGMVNEAAAMVGNSSSGLYEAPSLGCPVVNIGTRQDGRMRASSTIDCEPTRDAIGKAIVLALDHGKRAVENPYGDGGATDKIIDVLRRTPDFQNLLVKPSF